MWTPGVKDIKEVKYGKIMIAENLKKKKKSNKYISR